MEVRGTESKRFIRSGVSKQADDCHSSTESLITCDWLFWSKKKSARDKQATTIACHSSLLFQLLTPTSTSKHFKMPAPFPQLEMILPLQEMPWLCVLLGVVPA